MAQTHAIKNAIQKEVHQCSSTQNVEETADVFLFSFIRTITVGSGISPDLLTSTNRALAGSLKRVYRRWGISPRPENIESNQYG